MRVRFDAAGSQAQKMAMLRRYGWGVPDLGRALMSASNDATLMVEDALLPFRKEGSAIKTRSMNLHRLPWPRQELLALENVLLIPHLASATTETRTAMADLAVSNAVAVLNGQPPLTPVH